MICFFRKIFYHKENINKYQTDKLKTKIKMHNDISHNHTSETQSHKKIERTELCTNNCLLS